MAVLGIEEIEELLDEIRSRVLLANRTGTLDQLLTVMGMHDLIEPQAQAGNRDGKIVVLGASDVDEAHLLITAGKLGIDKNRFEFCLDYDAIQKYNFRKLQYSDKYRVILVGPMPHSSAGKAESGSAIADMERHQDMYPRIIRMNAGTTLKITKSGFRETLKTLLHENYI
jgi:hypothetical protein